MTEIKSDAPDAPRRNTPDRGKKTIIDVDQNVGDPSYTVTRAAAYIAEAGKEENLSDVIQLGHDKRLDVLTNIETRTYADKLNAILIKLCRGYSLNGDSQEAIAMRAEIDVCVGEQTLLRNAHPIYGKYVDRLKGAIHITSQILELQRRMIIREFKIFMEHEGGSEQALAKLRALTSAAVQEFIAEEGKGLITRVFGLLKGRGNKTAENPVVEMERIFGVKIKVIKFPDGILITQNYNTAGDRLAKHLNLLESRLAAVEFRMGRIVLFLNLLDKFVEKIRGCDYSPIVIANE